MILDICFTDKAPLQYQNVRMTTIYTLPEGTIPPEMVLHFQDYTLGQVNIPLHTITSVQVTND